MTTAKEYSDNVQREVNIDVDALLEAIQKKPQAKCRSLCRLKMRTV